MLGVAPHARGVSAILAEVSSATRLSLRRVLYRPFDCSRDGFRIMLSTTPPRRDYPRKPSRESRRPVKAFRELSIDQRLPDF